MYSACCAISMQLRLTRITQVEVVRADCSNFVCRLSYSGQNSHSAFECHTLCISTRNPNRLRGRQCESKYFFRKTFRKLSHTHAAWSSQHRPASPFPIAAGPKTISTRQLGNSAVTFSMFYFVKRFFCDNQKIPACCLIEKSGLAPSLADSLTRAPECGSSQYSADQIHDAIARQAQMPLNKRNLVFGRHDYLPVTEPRSYV